MNEERRRSLHSICDRFDLLVTELQKVVAAETAAFESRTISSQHSEGGYISAESMEAMDEAANTVSNAAHELRTFVEAESRPSLRK